MVNLKGMSTEQRNPDSSSFSSMNIEEAVLLMNQEDEKAVQAVRQASPQISEVIALCIESLRKGGRIIYCGAGTSGRLGVLDAVECPPTFGVDYNTVLGLIAGGENAFVKAKEGAEDSREQGQQALEEVQVSASDIVIGIAASGRTPFVLGALEFAQKQGIATAAVVCNENSTIEALCPHTIVLKTGPEVLTGSTRLKAGTATKMTLNMISTISMAKTGKVYQNYMVDVKMTNEKLVSRGLNIIQALTGASEEAAAHAVEEADQEVKTAIVMLETGCSASQARELLDQHQGCIDAILQHS